MQVYFYYKPRNTYPERIYALYGDWNKRNTRAMGISTRLPFASRQATSEEKEHIKQSTRMTYFQYENLQTLIDDERRFQTEDQVAIFAERLESELKSWGSKELVTQLPMLNLGSY